MKERTIFAGVLATFAAAYFLPVANPKVQEAALDALRTLQWYARYHTLGCVVPAMFIAGAIATFLSKERILKYLGPTANKATAYGVASISGTLLAVCSCSVLPMFAGIYRVGAGLGPACAFLCSGPALSVVAIFLTSSVLGVKIGVARTVLAIAISLIVGLLMSAIFRRDETKRIAATLELPKPAPTRRKPWQTFVFLSSLLAFLVVADWPNPGATSFDLRSGAGLTRIDAELDNAETTIPETTTPIRLTTAIQLRTSGDFDFQLLETPTLPDDVPSSIRAAFEKDAKYRIAESDVASFETVVDDDYRWSLKIHESRWNVCAALGLAILAATFGWLTRAERREWLAQTWAFSKTIVPLLFGGILVTGFVASLLPAETVATWVGGNSLRANAIASVVGSLWYFATLTEIPLMQALLGLGMGEGPALTLLLAGPTLSLPSIVVIGRYLGAKKAAVFVGSIVVFSALSGWIFGMFC